MNRLCSTPRRLLVVIAVLTAMPLHSLFADALDLRSNDLNQIESEVRTLQQQYANPIASTRFYTLQRRLIDAQIQFELKDYERASILLTDALSFRGIEKTRDYVPTVMMLGRCHFYIKNYNSARAAFRKAYAASYGTRQQEALYYLVEVALETHDLKALQQLFRVLSRIGVSSMRPETQYVFGKALYQLGEVHRANQIFTSVLASSPYYYKAQYFKAALLVRRGLLRPALQLFTQISQAKIDKRYKDMREVVELAHLALGRIYHELAQYSKALDHYQEIRRQSPHFVEALYEIAWVFIKRKNYKKALDALDVLLLVSEDNALAIEGNILKGRLNLMLNDYSSATETFQELVTRFEPIRSELAKLKQDKQQLARYFRSLLLKRTDRVGLERVLSEKAAKWVESDENMLRIIGLLGRMSKDRRDVEETMRTIRLIEQALSEPNRVKIFPTLKKGYVAVLEAQNRLILVNKFFLDRELRVVRNVVDPKDQSTFAQMTDERHALERRLLSMPLTIQDLTQRTLNVHAKYDDLKKEARVAETQIALLRKQLDAIDQFLRTEQVKRPERKNDPKTKAIEKELLKERDRLRDLYKRLVALKESIEREVLRVGVGDFVVRAESNLKAKLLRMQRRDGKFMRRFASSLNGKNRSLANRLHGLRDRVWAATTALDNITVRIEQKIDEKVRTFQTILQAEKAKLVRYRRSVENYERDSRLLSGEIGQKQFDLVYKKLSNIILEADVGILDVAWKKKKDESQKIRKLQEDQRKLLLNLRRNYQALIKGSQ
ncbi:MAG: tetratricopeptide repeat protein [Myxococcales bacterium]|nr:tetratricopeptide repeat protein [Myxococcales bacterium]